MTKPLTPKPGDKWTRDEDGMLWVYRKDCAVVFSRTGFTAGPVTCRSAHEIDINTFAAHAQLREWGYEVTGEQLAGDEQPITESRVREIVAQMLAAQPTPAEVREAANVASDPKTEWVEVDNCRIQAVSVDGVVFAYMLRSPCGKLYLMADLTWKPLGGGDAVMVWDSQEKARAALAKAPPPPDVADFNGLKEAVAPEPVRWSDICDTPHSLRVAIDGPIMAVSPAWTGERVVIMDVPANIAATEPDWKGLLVKAATNARNYLGMRPLNSEVAALREELDNALAAARTNGGGK